jgi:hypothetical protein
MGGAKTRVRAGRRACWRWAAAPGGRHTIQRMESVARILCLVFPCHVVYQRRITGGVVLPLGGRWQGGRVTRHTEGRVMKRVVAIILGGGAGTRLYPLTKLRAKPAVPLGAKYRLIDIPISNCINSEIPRIYVLTQFNSASLNRHIARTYAWAGAGFSPGFVEVLAAQQTPDSPHWFQGTADAVRQYLGLFAEWDVDQYLILSGDQLYRMNYAHLLQRHRETKAAITLGVVPVEARRASDFGLLRTQGKRI